jgi:UDP-N-acetylglucosamine:LPS N-acetylglucosamine transferase
VRVEGVVSQADALVRIRAADILIGEGTSTMHEGAALRTPMVLVPGPISETLLLAQALGRHHAAHSIEPQEVSADALMRAFRAVLDDPQGTEAMMERASSLVTGGGGAEAAARLVLQIGAKRRSASAV